MSRSLGAAGRAGVWLVATLALLELASLALLAWHPDWPSRAELQASLRAPAPRSSDDLEATAADLPRLRYYELHPYLGFVRDRTLTRHELNFRMIDEAVNEDGFFGPSPLESPADDELVVAITGGSVASELFVMEGEALKQALTDRGFARGRRIRLVSLAIAGMKQPQQVAALSYFLARGAHFDVLINVDGFNEVVLPLVDNLPTGVPAAFPRNWRLYAAKALDAESVVLTGRLSLSLEATERWRVRLDRFPLDRSSFVLAVWHAIRRSGEQQRSALELALRERLAAAESVAQAVQQPLPEQGIDAADLREAVALWRSAALVLRELSRAHGITYLHLLQPNQYFPGGRAMTEDEQRTAIAPPDFKYRVAAELGYPLLIEAGRTLVDEGYPLLEITDVVAAEPESVYRDRCCHLTRRGNALLIEAIAEAVAAAGAQREPAAPGA